MTRRGRFITLEGPDGCGKTTQSERLASALRKKGFQVLHTREPGGTPFAEALRAMILSSRFQIDPLTEILLYEASRAQHTTEVIQPALAKKKIVVCDRYFDATTAYQGFGRGLDLKMVRNLNLAASGGLKPDLTICLEVPPRMGFRRIRHRKMDRLEREKESFHKRVREGYAAIARDEPSRVKMISGLGTIEEIHGRIWNLVYAKLKRVRHV